MRTKNKFLHIPVTKQEHEQLKQEAAENGFATMAQYCRFVKAQYDKIKRKEDIK